MAELDLLAADVGSSGRSLRRAAARGLIRVRRPSPYKVELCGEERRYIRTHWPLLRALSAALRTEHNVRLAVLYGSAARGDDRPGSDVDLIVALEDQGRGLPIARLGMKLEGLLGRPVQIVSLGEAESSPALLADAVREGRVVVDRDRAWEHLRRAERALARRAQASEAELQAAAREALRRFAR
jgi:predicted nucleotidyltransferase